MRRGIGRLRAGGNNLLQAQVVALFGTPGSLTPGVMFDYTDPSKLFQNSAGTGAVSADNDPIGFATDLSGNGKHATQATGANRPLWAVTNPRAVFDGAVSTMSIASINLTGTDKVAIIIALRNSATGAKIVVEASANYNTNAGSFLIATGALGGLDAAGNGSAVGDRATPARTPPYDTVVTGEYDLAQAALTNEIGVRLDTVAPTLTDSFGPLGTGNFGNYAWFIGARAGTSLFFTGSIYRMFVIGRTLTSAERTLVERWCGIGAGLFF